MEDQYCRLCMAEENLCPMSSSIRTCIKNEYSIVITDNDELSKEICRQCEAFVSEIISFREKTDGFGDKINKVQKLLQKILKRKDTPTRAHSDTINITNEDAPITIEKPCSDKTPRKSDKTIAFEDLTSETNVTSSSSNDFITKIIKSIDIDEVERTAQRITSNTENNFCPTCKTKVADLEKHIKSNMHLFKAHVIKQSGDNDIFTNHLVGYKCSSCSEVFTSKKVLAAHSKNQHKLKLNHNNLKPNTLIPKNIKINEDDGVKKDEVLPEFIVKEEPDSSETIIHPSKAHICIACKKAFGFAESLQRHQTKHHKGTLFCRHCKFMTINGRTFSDHLRKHYNLSHFQRLCSLCFKVCESIADLMAHRKEVHETTIFQICLLCNEKFPTTTLLKKHKRDVHRSRNDDISQQNKFKCRKCNRGFQSLLVLEKHQCTTMRYPCFKKCGRRFEHFGKMERHAAKCNSGRTIYSCQKCQKSLKTLGSYKTHLTKCSLEVSVPPTEKTNVKSAEKIRKTSENQASCSAVIQPSPAKTNDVSKKHRIDFAETTERKKIKTAPISISTPNYTNTKIVKKVVKKTLRKIAKTKIKKTQKPKVTRVKKVTGHEKKKLTKLEENLKPQIPSNSMDNSKTQEETMALSCETCGLLFKDLKFLEEHKSVAHASVANENKKHITEVFKKEENEIQPAIVLSEVPNCDDTKGVRKLKWKTTTSPSINENVIQVGDVEISVLNSNSSLVGQETKKNDAVVVQSDTDCLNSYKREVPLTRNDGERSVENLSSEQTISFLSKSPKIDMNLGISTRNDVDRSKNVSFSSESSNVEKNQTTSSRDQYCSSGFKTKSSSWFRNEDDRRSSSSKIKFTDINQSTSSRNDDHRQEYRSSYKSSKFAELQTPTRNHDSLTDSRRSSQPTLEKRYSSTSEISPKTPQDDIDFQRSFQPRSRNHCFDLSRKTHSTIEKYGEMGSRKSNDYNKDRFSSRHHIPRSQSNRRDGPDRRNVHTPTAHIDRRISNQSRYPENTHASFPSRLEPRIDFKQGPVTKSPTIAPSTSEISHQDKTVKKNDLTIISISRSPICGICKNPDSHLFCNPCSRCFLKNEVQYFNHMKMKHS